MAGGAWTRGRVGGGAGVRIRERIGGVVGSGLMNGWVGMMGSQDGRVVLGLEDG